MTSKHKWSTAIACLTAALLVTTLGLGAAQAGTLTGMTVSEQDGSTRIHVEFDGPADVSWFTLSDPPRLLVDCRGIDALGLDAIPTGSGLAGSIEASVWRGDLTTALTRIAVDLDSPSKPEVTTLDSGVIITLHPDTEGSWVLGQDGSDDIEELSAAEEIIDNPDYERPAYMSEYVRTEPGVVSFLEEETTGLGARGGARVSLDIQGADIYTVLRSISEYAGVNIVVGYDVARDMSEPVSFNLKNVPWGDALEMVLRSAHLWYSEENGIIRVDTESNLRKEELEAGAAARQLEAVMPLTTRIIHVVYATAHELRPAVVKSLSERGFIEVDPRTNSLVVTDIPGRVEAAVEMVQHLDSQTPQIEIVAKMVDVDARYTQELGVLWGVSDVHGGGGGSADGAVGSNTVSNATAALRFGLVKDWGSINATLSAMEQDQKADIISNPRITTVNNREARILVGKKIPLIVLDEAGNAVTQLTTIGITLRVTPHINDNNRITLDMHPEVSDLSSQATVQGGIIINTSEADTRVMVDNGETAVIGGLIRVNNSTLERGVPFLKDIPVLGWLFKGTSVVKEKRELLIFVTPRIVNSFAANGSGQ